MPSHFSTLGFDVQTQESFVALATQVATQTQPIPVRAGQYLRWVGGSGEELWLQTDEADDLVGMNPHFNGNSSVRVRLQARVGREGDTVLDGSFQGWADPEQEKPESGAYPLVFDLPDAATYFGLELPCIVEAQIAAFAHEVSSHASPDAYSSSQEDQQLKFASQSFIPSGMFQPDGAATEPPEAMAIFTGHVIEAGVRKNSLTGRPFFWALLDTLGGKYDVVIDPALLKQVPPAGGVLSGSFWLSGRLTSFPKRQRSWLGRVLRGAG